MLWYICDDFGFSWGDVYETRKDAMAGLARMRKDKFIIEHNISLTIAPYYREAE